MTVRLFQQYVARNKEVFLRIHRLICRNTYGKYRTATFIVFILNRTFMHLHQFVAQMQTDPNTVTGEITLHKPLEQFILFLFRNPHSRIRNLNLQCLFPFVHIHRKNNRSVGRSIFKCI